MAPIWHRSGLPQIPNTNLPDGDRPPIVRALQESVACECDIIVNMTEDEELRELIEPWPDEAKKAATIATFEAFEEELWRWREERRSARGGRAGSPAPPPPFGRAECLI